MSKKHEKGHKMMEKYAIKIKGLGAHTQIMRIERTDSQKNQQMEDRQTDRWNTPKDHLR